MKADHPVDATGINTPGLIFINAVVIKLITQQSLRFGKGLNILKITVKRSQTICCSSPKFP